MLDVLKSEGGTKTFPRFEARQAAMGGGFEDWADEGSQPAYTLPEEVVMLVMRPCADIVGMSAASRKMGEGCMA